MEFVANPILLYSAIALGGVGVAVALPKRGLNPQVIGAIVAAVGLGLAFLALGLAAGGERPGFYFYVFSAIALGASLRVISHPKPVYAALYFIVTILASSALYLMLGAEFMAFALIIIYAGAILITYLFVIMLAESAPGGADGGEVGTVSEYDRFAREPLAAAAVGFVLLGALTAMLAGGLRDLRAAEPRAQGIALLERMPKKVLEAYERLGVFEPRGGLRKPAVADVADRLDIENRVMRLGVADPIRLHESVKNGRVDGVMLPGERVGASEASADAVDFGARLRDVPVGSEVVVRLPPELRAENLDGVGFTLIAEHPMALELAGVILLMAMLGAVVLARKQIEIGEAEKAAAARPGY